MPCNDGGYFRESEADLRRERATIVHAADFEAVLCGILSVFPRDDSGLMLPPQCIKDLFDEVDWKEVGVTRKRAEKWWKDHQKEDEERRVREAELQAKLAARESALAKLTPAERHALGL